MNKLNSSVGANYPAPTGHRPKTRVILVASSDNEELIKKVAELIPDEPVEVISPEQLQEQLPTLHLSNLAKSHLKTVELANISMVDSHPKMNKGQYMGRSKHHRNRP